jgi:hypothetical protein
MGLWIRVFLVVPLAEQSFMQYMQFIQETQNKFMQELMGQIGAERVPEVRG